MYEPGLNCANCAQKFAQLGLIPRCRKARGCEIEEIAKDRKIEEICRAFIRSKQLSQDEAYNKIRAGILEEAKLDDPMLLIALESRYNKWLKHRREIAKATSRQG